MDWTFLRRGLGVLLLSVLLLLLILLGITMNEIVHESEAARREHASNTAPLFHGLVWLAWMALLGRVGYILTRYGRPARLESGILFALHLAMIFFIFGRLLLFFLPTGLSEFGVFYGVWMVIVCTLLDMALPPRTRIVG